MQLFRKITNCCRKHCKKLINKLEFCDQKIENFLLILKIREKYAENSSPRKMNSPLGYKIII